MNHLSLCDLVDSVKFLVVGGLVCGCLVWVGFCFFFFSG